MVKHRGIAVKGFKIKDGKLIKIHSYGLNASAKIAQRKSKKISVKRKTP